MADDPPITQRHSNTEPSPNVERQPVPVRLVAAGRQSCADHDPTDPRGVIQVQTTVAARSDADRIARALVERRLAACVQVMGPIRRSVHARRRPDGRGGRTPAPCRLQWDPWDLLLRASAGRAA
jgi:hypothetical protein